LIIKIEDETVELRVPFQPDILDVSASGGEWRADGLVLR
jgi:hypothetical protein